MKSTIPVLISLWFVPFLMFAQGAQFTLPNAGLTPENPLYFLDRLGEQVQQFFTFNPEAKAKLQIEFAEERIAEIKVMVEEGGANSKGLAVAKALLQESIAYADEIVLSEKTSGKDVSALAQTLNDEFDAQEKFLEQMFEDAKENLETRREEIQESLLEDGAQKAMLEAELNDLDEQIDMLGQTQDELEESLHSEQWDMEFEIGEEDIEIEDEFEMKEFDMLDEMEEEKSWEGIY